MELLTSIKRLGDLGIKKDYQPWERYITRMLNFMTLASLGAMLTGLVLYICFGSYNFVYIHLVALVVFPLIMVLNTRFNYIWALYAFFFIIVGLMLLFFHYLGNGSRSYLFMVPFIIGLLVLLNRKELQKHLVIMLLMFAAFIGICLAGYFNNWFPNNLTPQTLTVVRIINIFFSSVLTIVITYLIIRQNLRQERELNGLIREKETLLAEVHHRVKNNMAIISSLLNLRMEENISSETKEVLEDTKNKIYSMALIHKKVYDGKTLKDINFHEYISELANRLTELYKRNHSIRLNVDARECILQLDTAIPCGFIINELLTNSCKYAFQIDKELELTIQMKKQGNNYCLLVSDNGPCFDFGLLKSKNTLGMNLIDMLNKQLDATYAFRKDNGLVYEMKFAI